MHLNFDEDPFAQESNTYRKLCSDLQEKAKELYTHGEKNRIDELAVYRAIGRFALLLLWIILTALAYYLSDFADSNATDCQKSWAFVPPLFLFCLNLFVGVMFEKITARSDDRVAIKPVEINTLYFLTAFSFYQLVIPYTGFLAWLPEGWQFDETLGGPIAALALLSLGTAFVFYIFMRKRHERKGIVFRSSTWKEAVPESFRFAASWSVIQFLLERRAIECQTRQIRKNYPRE